MSGASYPAPTLHNGVLNSVFNVSDFNSSSKSNNNINGNLVVSGTSTLNNNVQINAGCAVTGNCSVGGNETVSGITNLNGNVIISPGAGSNYLQLPSGKQITSTNDVIDSGSTQSISGVKTLTSVLNANGGVSTNNSALNAGTGALTAGAATCSGLITATGGLTLGTTSTLTLPSTQSINSSVTLVDLASAQTISGIKTFSSNIVASGGIQQPVPLAVTSSTNPVFNCNTRTYATFTMTMVGNISQMTFQNAKSGGQYIVFLTGGSSVYTISSSILVNGGAVGAVTNFASPVSIPINGRAILTIYYEGSSFYIGCSTYA